jgi:tubulin beta
MGTEFQEMLCDEHGIGGDGEYCGDNNAQLGRINVFYYEASCGKYAPRAVLFRARRDRRCARVASRRALPPGKPREP